MATTEAALLRELVFLIMKFLEVQNYKETVHKLEQESGYFFNMNYFEDRVKAGEWLEVERYLSGFTKLEDNQHSTKIFFEIRKRMYLEALDRHDWAKAVEILVKDLKVFASFNEEMFKGTTQLLTFENFRQHEQLSMYGDMKPARVMMLPELKKLIQANPLFRGKLEFPSFEASRLRTLINQSLIWQHQHCKNPSANPEIKTLFTDHSCRPANGAVHVPPPTNSPLPLEPIPKSGAFPPIGAHSPFETVVSTSASAIAGLMSNMNLPGLVPGLVQPPSAAAYLKTLRTPTSAPGMDYQAVDAEHLMGTVRMGQPDEVSFSCLTHNHNIYSQDDLPKTVVRTLSQGSNVMSIDFHPHYQTILLVGTNIGDFTIWEVGSQERLVHRPFEVWDTSACSIIFQTALVKDVTISVSRCIWSPDGLIFGVAFSKHLVQIYSYGPTSELRQGLEIDAHIGSVNDIAFAHPNEQLCIITCGDDKTIKVWDAVAGHRQCIFEGHEAPVLSVCPHYKKIIEETIHFIFSTAMDGRIKIWLYGCLGSWLDYDASGLRCTRMAYSADGTRLFSCGTTKEGESQLVEWNVSEGGVKRSYSGFKKYSSGVVQFDTTRNCFLAAGDDFQIKFWDMDNTNILTITDADGGLLASPRLRFNRDGSLLAVTTSDNGIKILANSNGECLIKLIESRSFDASRGPSKQINTKLAIINVSSTVTNVSGPVVASLDRISPPVSLSNMAPIDSNRTPGIEPRIVKIESLKQADIVDSAQLKALRLPDSSTAVKVVGLIYANSGASLLALDRNGLHMLWKWHCHDRNASDKSAASISPQLWLPPRGTPMTNDVGKTNSAGQPAACIALSKNDAYLLSISGGKVSLFNVMSFKVMATFMVPPPTATFLAFLPQDNNIFAVGMDDSTIHIYHVKIDKVTTKLRGHQERITGLAFSESLNVLVSSGADSQLCMWSIDGWEKKKSNFIKPPLDCPSLTGETKIQFHKDQMHLLVVHGFLIAVYDSELRCSFMWSPWFPRGLNPNAIITSAVYSCDGLLVYAGFTEGVVRVFDADRLRLRCCIQTSAFVPQSVHSNFPTVIAAHPSEPNQIALGMSDGAVYVIEPSDAEAKWGSPPQDSD